MLMKIYMSMPLYYKIMYARIFNIIYLLRMIIYNIIYVLNNAFYSAVAYNIIH
jgi:hypothetical protein